MDARPQRPLRAMRVHNDENLPPDGVVPKTIHQRNKSSPALTSAAALQNMKGPAKRTAFGDVSNIVAAKRTSKDDSTVPSKMSLQGVSKPGQFIQEKRSAAFSRPAQRPLSVAGLKSLLTGSNSDNVSKIPLNDHSNHSQVTSNTRKVLTKKHTTIFKDISLDTVQEVEPVQSFLPPTISETSDNQKKPLATETTISELDSKLHLPPPLEAINVEPVKVDQQIPSEISLPGIEEVNLNVPVLPKAPETVVDDREPTKQATEPPTVSEESDYVDALPIQPEHIVTDTVKKVEPSHIPETYLNHEMPAVYPITNTVPEQEEYWDEEYEDAYEEEGYVTARSFRSRGENTTGGATTVLFPQQSLKTRKEISAAKKLVEATRTPEEVEDEYFDTSMVAEYGDEIFEYMRHQELRMMPNAHYMENQHEIQWSMRSVLMDWLVQVHHRFNLLPETLFLCVNYIDRFLSCKVVSLGKLQLVGATAIFIAAKYEEINCPSVQEIVYMVDGGYSVDEILKAERFMLTMLQFELGWPGPMSFLRRISKADDYDLETRTLAKYFLEVTLMDERFIGSPPSFVAAASHCLARLMLRKGSWSPHHVYYSGYTWSQLKPIVQLLLECCEDPRKHHQAVYNKYCDKRYKRASAFVETEVHRGYQLPEAAPCSKSIVHSALQPFYSTAAYYA